MTNDKGEAARKASEGMKELLKSFVEMCQSRGDDYEPEQLEWLIEKFEASNRIKFDDDILDAALTRVLEEINPTIKCRGGRRGDRLRPIVGSARVVRASFREVLMSRRNSAFLIILFFAFGTALVFYRYFIAAEQVHQLELHEPPSPKLDERARLGCLRSHLGLKLPPKGCRANVRTALAVPLSPWRP